MVALSCSEHSSQSVAALPGSLGTSAERRRVIPPCLMACLVRKRERLPATTRAETKPTRRTHRGHAALCVEPDRRFRFARPNFKSILRVTIATTKSKEYLVMCLMHVKPRLATINDKCANVRFRCRDRWCAAVDDPSIAVCVRQGTELAFEREPSFSAPQGTTLQSSVRSISNSRTCSMTFLSCRTARTSSYLHVQRRRSDSVTAARTAAE
jgi:hypothetical protein